MGPLKTGYRIARESRRLLLRGKYRNAMELLEGLVGSGTGDPYVLFLLSIACLYLDEFQKALKIMEKLGQSWSAQVPYLQLHSFLALKSAPDKGTAVRIYSDLAGRHPGDRLSKRLLNRLIAAEDFPLFQRNAKLTDFVTIPRPPRVTAGRGWGRIETPGKIGKSAGFPLIASVKIVLKTAAVLLALSILVMAGALIRFGGPDNLIAFMRGGTPGSDVIERVSLDGYSYDLVTGKSAGTGAKFYYSSGELVEDFNRAKSLIRNGRHNDALAILNRIYSGNVSFVVKEKTEFLIRWITHVEERNFEEIPFADVKSNPNLFRGYSLRWKGKVANQVRRQDSVSFTLLVDYREKGTFSGVVEVFYEGPARGLENGSPVRVDGVLTSVMRGPERLYLVARQVELTR